jgi:3-hydroxyisobutyryl-CoA hydrolase
MFATLLRWKTSAAGIATHFVANADLQEMEDQLLVDRTLSDDEIEAIISRYHHDTPPQGHKSVVVDAHWSVLPWVNSTFNGDTVEEIVSSLERLAGDLDARASAWAQEQLAALNKMSPTALKVVHRQLREGANKSVKECFEMEYRISQEFQRSGSDFFEGVRSVLVDKDNAPTWSPSSLSAVDDAIVDRFFRPIPNELVLPD